MIKSDHQQLSVSLLNTGKLGSILSKKLQKQGVFVQEGYRFLNKEQDIQASHSASFEVRVSKEGVQGDIESLLKTTVCVISLPFKRSLKDPFEYLCYIEKLMPYFKSSGLKQVVFCSSTSVYAKKNGYYNEQSALDQNSPRARVLKQVEDLIQTLNIKVCILRLAGIWSFKRAQFRQLNKPIEGPNVLLNLVHEKDVIDAIYACIESKASGVFNVCAPSHPSRLAYYSALANSLALPKPQFVENEEAKLPQNRCIDGSFLHKSIGFSYKYAEILSEF